MEKFIPFIPLLYPLTSAFETASDTYKKYTIPISALPFALASLFFWIKHRSIKSCKDGILPFDSKKAFSIAIFSAIFLITIYLINVFSLNRCNPSDGACIPLPAFNYFSVPSIERLEFFVSLASILFFISRIIYRTNLSCGVCPLTSIQLYDTFALASSFSFILFIKGLKLVAVYNNNFC